MFVSFPASSKERWIISDAADNQHRNMSVSSSNTAQGIPAGARAVFILHTCSLENGEVGSSGHLGVLSQEETDTLIGTKLLTTRCVCPRCTTGSTRPRSCEWNSPATHFPFPFSRGSRHEIHESYGQCPTCQVPASFSLLLV